MVQRKNLEEAFGAPVYDQYGCCEAFWLAAQCAERGALHINHDVRHIEVVRGAGEVACAEAEGSVVITDLENFGYPLIRSVNGDTRSLTPGRCPCGVNLPLMSRIGGRVTDMIRTPSGGAVAGDFITTLYDDYPEVATAFQVVQAEDYSLPIFVVSGRSEDETRGVSEAYSACF